MSDDDISDDFLLAEISPERWDELWAEICDDEELRTWTDAPEGVPPIPVLTPTSPTLTAIFDDLSLAEIPPERWAEICRDEELRISTTHAPEVVPPTPVLTPTSPTLTEIFDALSLAGIPPERWNELLTEIYELRVSTTHAPEGVPPIPEPAPIVSLAPASPMAPVSPAPRVAPIAPASPVPSITSIAPVPPVLPAPPAANTKPSFTPVHSIGLRPEDLDIEDCSPNFSFSKEKRCLSVTNIFQPLWCEYKTKYDLVSFKHLPTEQRPDVIKVERTVIVDNKEVINEVSIRIDKEVAKFSEERTTQGTAIHKRLENELFHRGNSVPPKNPPQTPEDHWGHKLLTMIIRIERLKSEEAFTRELTVFGFVDDIPLTGIIDELKLQPVTPDTPTNGNILKISDYKTKSNPQAVSSFTRDRQAQLMLYKVLLDGLLSPNFDWSRFFKLWDLDPARAFSGSVKDRISNVIVKEGLDASLLYANTLEDFKDGWMKAVQTLDLVSGQVDSELTVIYRTPRNTSALAQRSNQDESDISDTKSFEYDEMFMKQILKESLEFWRGQRPLQGVGRDNWKCRSCEYKEDCEWRKDQAAVLSHETQA